MSDSSGSNLFWFRAEDLGFNSGSFDEVPLFWWFTLVVAP